MSIDSRLVGLWYLDQHPNDKMEFASDGKYFVYSIGPFTIDTAANPETLAFGGSRYDRIAGNPGTGIVGVWSDGADEIYFKSTNAYVWSLADDPLLPAIGVYVLSGTVNSGNIETHEMRSVVATNGNGITFDPPWDTSFSGTFQFSNNDNTVKFNLPRSVMILQRV